MFSKAGFATGERRRTVRGLPQAARRLTAWTSTSRPSYGWACRRRRLDPREWPMTMPAVAQVAREGLDLPKGVTFLVGENGSGKSTLVEAVPWRTASHPRAVSHRTACARPVPRSPRSGSPSASNAACGTTWGFFLRAETMHGWYTDPGNTPSPTSPRPGHPVPRAQPRRVVPRGARDPLRVPRPRPPGRTQAALSFSSTLALSRSSNDWWPPRAGALRHTLPRPRGHAGRPYPRGR